ncbi:MAG: hypothetical protein ACTSRG_18405 [Candidatus Helarchaeota archaeon]
MKDKKFKELYKKLITNSKLIENSLIAKNYEIYLTQDNLFIIVDFKNRNFKQLGRNKDLKGQVISSLTI